MVLGGIDEKYAAGPFSYVDLAEEDYYLFTLDDIFVGKNSYKVPNMRAIVDTGTSVIAGTANWILKLLEPLP